MGLVILQLLLTNKKGPFSFKSNEPFPKCKALALSISHRMSYFWSFYNNKFRYETEVWEGECYPSSDHPES